MANVIELTTRWREEGAATGVKNLTREITALTNAIGIGLGVGAISSVNVLAQALTQLIKLPGEAANQMAKLAREGKNTTQVFIDLAKAQDEASAAWQRLRENLATKVAGGMTDDAWLSKRIARGLPKAVGGSGLNYWMQDIIEAAENAKTGTDSFGQYRADRQAADERALAAARLADAKAIIAKQEAMERLATAIRAVNSIERPGIRAPLSGGSLTTQLYGSRGIRGELDDIANMKEQIGLRREQLLDSPNTLVNVGAQIASGLTSIISSFISGTTTLVGAFKSFLLDAIGSVVSAMAQIGLGNLLTSIGGSIFGPFGAFLGAVGGKLLGRSGAAIPRGGAAGTTVVFQGINTRDMYMSAVRGGEMFRANDLIRMRTEIA